MGDILAEFVLLVQVLASTVEDSKDNASKKNAVMMIFCFVTVFFFICTNFLPTMFFHDPIFYGVIFP